MLTVFGLLGALFAGIAADALLSTKSQPEDEPDDSPQEEDTFSPDHGSLLDDPDGDDDVHPRSPVSDDVDDPADPVVKADGGEGDDLITGGNSDDVLAGAAGNDQIDAQGGDDTVDAGSGNDIVWAGQGNDTAAGGDGNDVLHGQAGDDLITGDFGDDALYGHDGADSLTGGEGADTVLGGQDADSLDGGAGDDWVAGGEGDDMVAGGAGSDTLDGNSGNDILSGLTGKRDDGTTDFLNGGGGDDRLLIGQGDHASGDDGTDTFALHEWLSEGRIATIADYDFLQDQIVVVYDPDAHPDPQLSLSTGDENDDVTIFLDGAPVAVVTGGSVFLSDIMLAAA